MIYDYNNVSIRCSQLSPAADIGGSLGDDAPMIRLRSLWSRIDRFLAAMLLTVGLASLLPARGDAAVAVGWLTPAAIALLFFMHGAQLSPAAALLGARQWRLHTIVFLSTFVLFPLLGTAAHRLVPGLLIPPLWAGLILLTALPSTVQASIVFHVGGGRQRARGRVQRVGIEFCWASSLPR